MIKVFLYVLALQGTVRVVQCDDKKVNIQELLEKAISDEKNLGEQLAVIGERSINNTKKNLAEANETLTELFNHSMAVFSGQVENVQQILRTPLLQLKNLKTNASKRNKKYQKLIADLNKAIKKNNAACDRATPLLATNTSFATVFQTLKDTLSVLKSLSGDDNCPENTKVTSDVTTCDAQAELPTECEVSRTAKGIQRILVDGNVYEVFCEAQGWTVLMSRNTPTFKFNSSLELGNLCSEFLIEGKLLYSLFKKRSYQLEVLVSEKKMNHKINFNHFHFRANNHDEFILTAHGKKSKKLKQPELNISWSPFEPNIDNIVRIRMRPKNKILT